MLCLAWPRRTTLDPTLLAQATVRLSKTSLCWIKAGLDAAAAVLPAATALRATCALHAVRGELNASARLVRCLCRCNAAASAMQRPAQAPGLAQALSLAQVPSLVGCECAPSCHYESLSMLPVQLQSWDYQNVCCKCACRAGCRMDSAPAVCVSIALFIPYWDLHLSYVTYDSVVTARQYCIPTWCAGESACHCMLTRHMPSMISMHVDAVF